jgi:hypothetical protein
MLMVSAMSMPTMVYRSIGTRMIVLATDVQPRQRRLHTDKHRREQEREQRFAITAAHVGYPSHYCPLPQMDQ